MWKSCIACRQFMPPESFYLHPQMSNGRLNKCKDCCKRYAKRRRVVDDTVRERDRIRSKMPHRVAHAALVAARWRESHPEAYRAHTAVSNAIRDGRLHRQPCVKCGAEEGLHAHHEDYSRPLDVTWYCALHHHRHHAETGPKHEIAAPAAVNPGTGVDGAAIPMAA